MGEIIAAVRRDEDMEWALRSSVSIIFLLKTDINELGNTVNKAHGAGKKLFVHMDFAEGVGKDSAGCLYLKKLGVDGIITTRANIVKTARDQGISTVQRVFIVDSQSVETAVDNIKKCVPSMIELMPGIATKAISFFKERVSVPIIAGGLISTRGEAQEAVSAGADFVSTGEKSLW